MLLYWVDTESGNCYTGGTGRFFRKLAKAKLGTRIFSERGATSREHSPLRQQKSRTSSSGSPGYLFPGLKD